MSNAKPLFYSNSPMDNTFPKSGREARKNAKRDQIIQDAGLVFLEKGYGGASMSVIARKAGVSKGTLYNHFTDKEELFSAFFCVSSKQHLQNLDTVFQDKELPPQEALEHAAETLINIFATPVSIGLFRIIVAEAIHFPSLAETFWRYGFSTVLENLANWFESYASKGSLKLADSNLAAEQFIAMCQTKILLHIHFGLSVDQSPEAIKKIAQLTANSFLKIYRP
ncbi:TetR/AcrR family transcriptional regulator [Acetobacteraceae bacterium]|nr:TetR/AcrR family transcriptional regulator [Acetobacteraceae bacterium]